MYNRRWLVAEYTDAMSFTKNKKKIKNKYFFLIIMQKMLIIMQKMRIRVVADTSMTVNFRGLTDFTGKIRQSTYTVCTVEIITIILTF